MVVQDELLPVVGLQGNQRDFCLLHIFRISFPNTTIIGFFDSPSSRGEYDLRLWNRRFLFYKRVYDALP